MNSTVNTFTSKRPDPVTGEAGEQNQRGVSLYGVQVEYGLHCVLWLTAHDVERASSRDLADLQGVPPATMAKIMPKLEKAGIVDSRDGIAGGYALARPASDITVLDVVDAIEGGKRLFDCKEVRRGCVLFGGQPPAWSAKGVCGIHAVMRRAENRTRAELVRTSLADLAEGVRWPPQFEALFASWIKDRAASRNASRVAAVTKARTRPRET
ncbi:Rrf2 family protein [Novosphingobium gossypii]